MTGFLRRKETVLLAIALVLALIGVVFLYLSAPTRLTVAVGPAGAVDANLMEAFARQLGQQKTGLRLTLRPAPDVREAAQLLERGQADLAVVRTDVLIPQNGLTMAVMRESAVIIMTPQLAGPARSKITKITDFAGRKLGVVVSHEADPGLVASILKHFDLDASSVTVVPLGAAQALQALKSGEVNGLALVAPPTGTSTSEFVRGVIQAFGGKMAFVPIDTAEAIVNRTPALSAVTIPAGVWGGRPKQPDDDVKTLGVSYRLMARSDIDRTTISVATQYLFQMRSRLAAVTRAANFMKAPENDTATSAMLPNHPGAVDYFQREQETFMERYGDWVYLLALFGSGFASFLAWLRQGFVRQRREEIDDVLDRLLTILADGRTAETNARLDELSVEIDGLLSIAVGHARTGATDSRATSALVLAIDGARAVISDRRREVDRMAVAAGRREDVAPRLVTVTAGS